MDKKSFAGGLIVGSLVTITQPSFLGRVIFHGLWMWLVWVLAITPIMKTYEESKQQAGTEVTQEVISTPEVIEPEPEPVVEESQEPVIPTITQEEINQMNSTDIEQLEAIQVQEPEIEHDTEARNPTDYGFPERRTLQ